jgi:hypothetical protein
VTWDNSGGSTAGFNVYRSTSSAVPLSNPLNGSTPLSVSTTSFPDTQVESDHTYFYVVQAVSSQGLGSDASGVARATFGGADIRLSTSTPVLYAARNSGTVSGTVRVTNAGDAPLTVSGGDLAGASAFISLDPVPSFTLAGGEFQDLTFSFTPKANGPQHTTVEVFSDDPDTPTATIGIGGLAIDSTTTGEPSLQWIIDAYDLAADDGDAHPGTYPLDALAIPPADGILVGAFTPRDSSLPVQVTALAAFVNPATATDPLKDPSWGWTPANTTPGAATATYQVRRAFLGTSYAIDASGTFGLWVRVEGATLRTDTNTAANPRFIAFPVAGSPGTYVLADDTAGRTFDDWNDLPLLVSNVTVIAAG